ncbi:choice-of-anchor H family protein [Pleionea sp. CnH1-48]|uniref:choice-of-anchor H family protein n=1 Tax=Pleionea sp. CnH1-48 TaxID=2954494 RepID=UPI00209815FA|nr:choice-of-anchor H family protein [Pleionea sp. CnH1-48]MCO7227167.1 choice-of-anchor H family protein [Pleionea sp. CnH1-48]
MKLNMTTALVTAALLGAASQSFADDNSKAPLKSLSGLLPHVSVVEASNKKSSSEAEYQAKQSQRQSEISVKAHSGEEKKAEKKQAQKSKPREMRKAAPELSSHHHDFSFFDASVFLRDDLDNDGYYSRFTVEFDADTVYSWADVYAKLYISQNGSDWELYHTTDIFEINNGDGDDDYQVTTTLNIEYPADSYDILIDLYEYGYSGIVATIGPNEDPNLYDIPLEDRTQESSYQSGFNIYTVTTDLLRDNDGDGFFSEFAMAIDIDTDYDSADVYAEVYFENEQGNWELEYTSSTLTLNGDSTLDTLHLEFDWQSGYPVGYYDFKIIVKDAFSNQILVESFSQFGALNRVPLESADKDNQVDSVRPPINNNSSSSTESGGGSAHLLLPFLLLLAGVRRKFKK